MVFPVRQLVAYVSRFMSLQPGDLLSTGTPAGVGHGARPPRYLDDGDVVAHGDRRPRDPAAPGDRPPLVILVEHGTIITVDAGRRILTDGSVLIDGGRDRPGRARARRAPAAGARPGDRRAPDGGDARLRGHPRAPLRAPQPRPPARRHPGGPLPARLADPALLGHDRGGRGARGAPGRHRDDPHRHDHLLRGGHALRAGAVAAAVERLGMRAILGRWTWDLESGPDAHAPDHARRPSARTRRCSRR